MKKGREFLVGTFISILTICIVFASAELTLRVKHNKLQLRNYVEENWNLASWEFPIKYDIDLGWIPTPNKTTKSPDSKKEVTLLEYGIRANGKDRRVKSNSSLILAVGASTTFGSQVSDEDTWPALLSRATRSQVVNGGVFAYGFDQVILRMEDLITKFHPQRIIIGIHPDNLSQSAMSQKYAKKPYFEILNNKLILKNTPVPETKKGLSHMQSILGYSYLAHYLMSRLIPSLWLENHGEIRVHNKANEVSCLLIKRADRDCSRSKIKCSVLLQYFHTTAPEAREQANLLSSCIKGTKLELWDTYKVLEQIKEKDLKRYDSFFDFHMTPAGNEWVANYISEKIKSSNY